MPASPSDSRSKWKKRKRGEPLISRRHNNKKHEDEDDEDEDLVVAENDDIDCENNDEYEENHANPNPQSTSGPDPKTQEIEVLSDGRVRISDFPLVVRHVVNRPHSSVLEIAALERANQYGESKAELGSSLVLENVSYGQLQALSAVPADSPVLLDQERGDAGNAAYVVTPPPIMEGRGVVKRFGNRVHVVPMHSDWFSPATVHRLERQVVPHFFSGKSPDHTPEKYMECRNYIVAKYMENSEKRLLVSDCVGLVVDIDDEDLIRIVRFLDHWGIINYCAATTSHEPLNSCFYLREDPSGEIHVPAAALKSIDSLVKLDKPKCRFRLADIYSSLSSRDGDVSDLDNRIRERLSENHCSCCSQAIPIMFYQSQKEIDILLCSDCFHEGRYVTGHSSIDFVRVDSRNDYSDLDGENWTDQETLLLLEAMEIYNDNWNEIAEHVGSKSKAQCILHFLRLPVEEGLLENVEVPSLPIPSNSSNGDGHERLHSNVNGDVAGSSVHEDGADSRLPFANSGNPVMALAAFLASAIGPRVAAACAHASLAALSEEYGSSASGSIIQIEGYGHGNQMNLESTHGKEGGSYGEIPNSVKQIDENMAEAETLLSAEKVQAAAKVGLAAAATKAKLFADHEEREIQRMSASIINHQLKRLELKLKQFAEIESFLMKECEQVERTRQRFFTERARMLAAQYGPAGVTSSTSLPGAGPSIVNNNSMNNNRQHIMSTPPSQPSISGYGNNQSVQPNMSFRQSMFGTLGLRLPLSVIQPSSTSSNTMFNAPGNNSQPALSHPMMRPVTSSGLG